MLDVKHFDFAGSIDGAAFVSGSRDVGQGGSNLGVFGEAVPASFAPGSTATVTYTVSYQGGNEPINPDGLYSKSTVWGYLPNGDGTTTKASGSAETHLDPPPVSRHDPIGGLTHLGAIPGDQIELAGWVLDPDTYWWAPPAPVDVYLDGALVATAVVNWPASYLSAAMQTPPISLVPAMSPDQSNVFSVHLPVVTAGSHKVCVTARNAGDGADTSIGCATLDYPAYSPRGQFETTASGASVSVSGWVLEDSWLQLAPNGVWIVDNGQIVAQMVADRPSPMLYPYGVFYPHGFSHTYTPGLEWQARYLRLRHQPRTGCQPMARLPSRHHGRGPSRSRSAGRRQRQRGGGRQGRDQRMVLRRRCPDHVSRHGHLRRRADLRRIQGAEALTLPLPVRRTRQSRPRSLRGRRSGPAPGVPLRLQRRRDGWSGEASQVCERHGLSPNLYG